MIVGQKRLYSPRMTHDDESLLSSMLTRTASAGLLRTGVSAGFAEAAGRLRGGGHLADRQVAGHPAQAAVGGDLQPFRVAVLQAGAHPLDDVLGRLGVV